MKRRDFLKLTGLVPIALSSGALPRLLSAAPLDAGEQFLVLVELAGGNDGLNTVVPYADPLYTELRPSLGVPADEVIALSDALGLNPVLSPLLPSWESGQLAVVLGLGYPEPNRSHFRSIDIWETGSGSGANLSSGWVARALAEQLDASVVAEGIVMGDADVGPLWGEGSRALVLDQPDRVFRAAGGLREAPATADNPALAHLLEVQNDVVRAAATIEAHLGRAPSLPGRFPGGPLGRQLELAARAVAAEVPVPVLKLTQTGYDTHARQRGPHDRLLGELATGLAAFRDALTQLGRWHQVLVVTYSEFGRRVAENASGGTDHGTAAPHFVLGGMVVGGFYGRQPPLDDLDDGDLRFQVDYRSLYATIARRYWELSDDFLGDRYSLLDFLG
jgi:uncharacterized protein (DUF1501 family)